MNAMDQLLWILLLPLMSAAIIVIFLRKMGGLASKVSVLAAAGIAGLSVLFLLNWDGVPVHEQMEWFSLGDFTVSMGFFVDKFAATMLLVVSCVAFLIHVFSLGYMHDDACRARYFGGLSIFMFSMLGIVLADNLFMIFIFWELVGFSSYALIAHYKDTEEASMASKKAFIVNRVGDFGFLVGICWCYWAFGTLDLVLLAEKVGADPSLISSGLAALLICGFIGKSAQFPLHVWLPDAMAGPTPVSALIHAATMVAAGIYFLIRIFFLLPADVLNLIMWMGAVMTLFAGLCALGQKDIKKILAYSTLSQLGYMATAVGLGYPGLAIFHLGTHACFKALLFLGSGSVIHALHHEQDIYKMGGLLRRMPVTGFTFLLGLLALCGVTYTSGFFSKDAIIEAAYFVNSGAFWLILVSAFMTSLYMGRLFWVAFMGRGRSPKAETVVESGLSMTVPLMVLAVLSVVAGYLGIWPEHWVVSFAGELESVHGMVHDAGLGGMMLGFGTAAWVLGLLLSYVIYGMGAREDRFEAKVPLLYGVLKKKFFFDEIYNGYVLRVQQKVADLFNFIDLVFISGIGVRGSSGMVGLVGLLSRRLHVGTVHAYVYWFLAGVCVFVAFAFGWIG